MTRVAAGAFGFLIFSHAFDGPDLYGALSFFETMPSNPSLQTALNTAPPLASVWALSYRRKHGATEGEKIYRGVDGVRVLPLEAKRFPIFRLHSPILCRGVRWLGEEHKDNQVESD